MSHPAHNLNHPKPELCLSLTSSEEEESWAARVMSFLKSWFGSKTSKKQLAVVVPGKMFAWKAGCWLEATETTTFLLPGQLIRDNEKIGSIIETSSDDALIGFTQDPDTKNFTEIRLKLEAGQSATVHRSTQAMMLADDQRERKIYITLPDDPS